MRRINSRDQQGFTIIEVVLVLAIAGLIFLVVFLALPALQKSQRDTARRQDIGRVVASLQNYKADNNNQFPFYEYGLYWANSDEPERSVFNGYFSNLAQLDKIFTLPDDVGCDANWNGSSTHTMAVVAMGCRCDNLLTTTYTDVSARFAAVYTWLESGSKYCKDV